MTLVVLLILTIILFLAVQLLDYKTRYEQPAFLIYSIPLILYILTYGLRDGWFQDFAVYENIYMNPFLDSEYDPFFILVNRIMRFLNFPLFMAMTVYVAFFVVGIFFFFMQKRKYLGIAMAITVMVSVMELGMLIRWLFGLGLLLASMRYFIQKELVKCLVFFVLAVCTHFPLIIVGVIALLCYYFNPFRNVYVSLALLFLSLLITPQVLASWTLFLLEHLNIFPSSLHVSAYINNPHVVDKYFAGDNLGLSESLSKMTLIKNVFYYCWFIVCGYLVQKKNDNKLWKTVYNLFVLSAIFAQPSQGFELMMRFEYALMVPAMLLFAKIIVDFFKKGYLMSGLISIFLLLLNFGFSIRYILSEYNLNYISF